MIQEPDSGFNPFQIAPRLMMNLADVDKTGAVQPGSRVTWRYKFGGSENQLDGYEKWLLPQLKPEQRWYGLEQDEGALGRSIERSQQFLLLSALLTLLLAVAAVAVAMNHYCRSRYDLVAILKTLGAGRAQLRKLIVGQWLMVLALSAVTGGAIGLLFENVLMVLLKPVLPAALPPASLWPWLWALGTMTVISLLVGLRPYRLLLATQPLRVLRNDVVANVWPLKFYLPIVTVVVVLLLAGLMGGSMLLWAVLAGAVVLALLCGVLGWMLLNVLRRMTLKSLPLRLAVSRLLRQPWSTLSQLSAFSLSFMLLALLLVLRGDLLDRWQQQLPPESPNYFLINIATEQVTPLKAFLAEHQIVPESFYPVVRARLTAINDKPTEGNGDEALNRELNLTWQNTRPDHNPIVAGNWPPKADEVSMEEGLAKRLNVALGDTVHFYGRYQEFRAKVTSLRKVDWESLRPNFYFIFPEGALDGQPQSWLTSFRWENGNGMLTQLNRQFPTISLLDIGAILKTGRSGAGAGKSGAGSDGGAGHRLRYVAVAGTGAGGNASASSGAGGVAHTLVRGKNCCAPRCGVSSPCSGLYSAWWPQLVRKRRWRCCRRKCLISRGSQTGDCGLFCRAAERCCCRFAAAGWVRDCLRVRRCSGSLRGDEVNEGRSG